MKAALYARVSTDDKGQDPEMQLSELRDYAARKGWSVFREYVDIGVSGAKERRPQLDRLMADAAAHRIGVVLVWRVDRLSRSIIHFHQTVRTWAEAGIEFCSSREQFDTTTPTGKLMMGLLALFAEFERNTIRERVKAGIANKRRIAKETGKKFVHGRPKRPGLDPVVIALALQEGESLEDLAQKNGCAKGTIFNRGREGRKILAEQGIEA